MILCFLLSFGFFNLILSVTFICIFTDYNNSLTLYIVQIYYVLIIVDEHLSGFHFGAIIPNNVRDSLAHVSWNTHRFISGGCGPMSSRLMPLEHLVCLFLMLKRLLFLSGSLVNRCHIGCLRSVTDIELALSP